MRAALRRLFAAPAKGLSRAGAPWWRHCLLWAGWALLMVGGGAWAQDCVTALQPGAKGVALAECTSWLIDGGGAMNLEAARQAAQQGRFSHTGKPVFIAGGGQAVWLRIPLHQSGSEGNWVISLPGATFVQDMRFYGPFDANGWALAAPVLTGSQKPFATRALGSAVFSMPLALPRPGDYTVFIRSVSEVSRTYDFHLSELPAFYEAALDKQIFDGLCYGVMLGLLLYNLTLFFVFRDPNYGLYLVSSLLGGLTMAEFNGHIAHYLLPNHPLLEDRLNTVLPALWIGASLLFAYSFLEMRRFAWRAAQVVPVLAAACAFSAVLGGAGALRWAQHANEILSLLSTATVVAGAVWAWRRDFGPARIYLLGQCMLLPSVVLVVLNLWGLALPQFVLDNALQSGAAVEIVMFAMALSSRIRLLQAREIELTRHAEQLLEVSQTDALTGLTNRSGLLQRAETLLLNGRRRSLVLVDLDRFKPVNDQKGHAAGDAMLVEIARRLRSMVRSQDLAARIGGDEFVLLFSEPRTRASMEAFCTELLALLSQPLQFEGSSLRVGASMGIASHPEDGASLPDLVRAADMALYHVKRHGRDGYAFFADLSEQQRHGISEELSKDETRVSGLFEEELPASS